MSGTRPHRNDPPPGSSPGTTPGTTPGAAHGASGGADKPGLSTGPGRFAYDGLERVIHERARLSIMTSLAAHPRGLLFNDLRQLCSLTDGNLNRHLAVLEEAGLVEVWKGHHNRRPQTLYRVTPTGRQRMMEYLAELERVLADATAAEQRWGGASGASGASGGEDAEPGAESGPGVSPHLRPA